MSSTVLIVEDNAVFRGELRPVLEAQGWKVVEAATDQQALHALAEQGPFDAMLLDIILNGSTMNGFGILDRAHQEGLSVPPVIVVSNYLDASDLERLLDRRIRAILPKPVALSVVADLLRPFCERNEIALLHDPRPIERHELVLHIVEKDGVRTYVYQVRDSDIFEMADNYPAPAETPVSVAVQEREAALIHYFRERAMIPPRVVASEPLLVVARRWNSWYPSFFDVEGGCYAVLGAQAADGGVSGVLVDPGMHALRVLESVGFPVGCLGTCIITHNHPDHSGGFFEYLAARHAFGQQTKAFCAPPVHEMFKSLSGFGLELQLFDQQPVDLLPPYEAAGRTCRRLRAVPVQTLHGNVGQFEGTRGIALHSEELDRHGSYTPLANALLLGDTEYDRYRANHVFDDIRGALQDDRLKIVVLHLGSSQLKAGTGKHLYLQGVIDILLELEYWRRTHLPAAVNHRLLVLISEWGLEHCTVSQLEAAVEKPLSAELRRVFSSHPNPIETVLALLGSYRFETLTILPADIGLTAGIETGGVYLTGSSGPVPPERVRPRYGAAGIDYYTV